jgi:hypothetical protein
MDGFPTGEFDHRLEYAPFQAIPQLVESTPF